MRKILAISLLALLIVTIGALGASYLLITHRVEGNFLNSAGIPIHYTDEGTGEPVLLLHGFAVNADLNWRRPGITRALAHEFRVVSLDLRGHGLSGKPPEPSRYGIEMVEDVNRLMNHLEIEKAHVVGYSLGGFVSLKFAAMHPDRLFTLSPLASGWEKPDNSDFLNALKKLAGALESGKGIAPLSGYLGGERKRPGLLHTWWVKLMTGYFNDSQAIIGVINGIPDIALTEEDVRRISVPVLSIVGNRDPLMAGVDAMKGLVRDHTVVIVQDSDHIMTTMRPEFIEALMDFLHTHSEESLQPERDLQNMLR